MVISHSHYDHLDVGSVASLNARFGGSLRWWVCRSFDQSRVWFYFFPCTSHKVLLLPCALSRFVPLGLMDWLVKMGCENVIELDWWEENCVPGHDDVTFVCTPSQHWSKRTALDDNKVTAARRSLKTAPRTLRTCQMPLWKCSVAKMTSNCSCVPQSLWGSWSILGPDHRFFFAGDTGYCSTFQEIGRRFGPFDLAAIPIGAYHPRFLLSLLSFSR